MRKILDCRKSKEAYLFIYIFLKIWSIKLIMLDDASRVVRSVYFPWVAENHAWCYRNLWMEVKGWISCFELIQSVPFTISACLNDFFLLYGVWSNHLNFKIPGGDLSCFFMMHTLTSQLLLWSYHCSRNCQPLIQASHLQVGNLVPEDTTLCLTHKYLFVWAQREKIQHWLCIQNTSIHKDELAFKFLETFSKTIEELQINKALCIIKLQNSTVIKTYTIMFPWQHETNLLFY